MGVCTGRAYKTHLKTRRFGNREKAHSRRCTFFVRPFEYFCHICFHEPQLFSVNGQHVFLQHVGFCVIFLPVIIHDAMFTRFQIISVYLNVNFSIFVDGSITES